MRMAAEEEMDIPEGYRLISSMTPGERARIDQTIAFARQAFTLLCQLMEVHQTDDHPDGKPCELPCGSVEVYGAIEQLEIFELRKILYTVVHDSIRMGVLTGIIPGEPS